MSRNRVRISAQAEAQLSAIRSWWIENRPAAPRLFDRELDAAITAMASAPAAFPIYRREGDALVRRVFLTKTRYAIYYVETPAALLVVAIWHTARGHGPQLP